MNNAEPKIEALVSQFLKPVYNLALRLTGDKAVAEDITQEVFVKVWKNLAKYDPAQNLKTWVMVIARRTAIDWLRKKKAVIFSNIPSNDEQDFGDNLLDHEPLPDELFARQELSADLDQILNTLSLPERAVILWHLEEDLTFEQIAETLDEPLNTVKSRYRRAILKLRQLLIAPK